MITRAWWPVCGILLQPCMARAQVLNGVAEWAVVRGGQTSSDGVDNANNSLWQRYTVGYTAPVLDPRLLKCTAEASFRTTGLSTGSQGTVQEGHQRDVSYNLGASVFPSRPFPFFIDAMRDTVGESGDYPASSGIRGGIPLPPGTPRPDFRTRNKALNMGWQLNATGLPRIELGYRTRQSQVSGGPFDAAQSDGDLHAGIFEDTTRTRQSLRFQRTSFENAVSQVFDQRLSDLDYDLGVTLGQRSRARAHAGRRSTFSRFDLPSAVVDPGTGSYSPPSRGDVTTRYALGGVTYEPNGRVSIDLAANIDRQSSPDVATSARLATTTARFDVARGLSLNTAGTYGSRGQVIAAVPVHVRTQTGQAGANYRAGVRWLEASAGVTRGIGSSVTPDGESGRLQSWTGQTGLSLSTPWIGVSLGYDRASSRDAILVFGNYESAREYASGQKELGHVSLNGMFENAIVQRGRDIAFATNHQQTYTTSVAYRYNNHAVSANGGGFKNRSEVGRDVTWFWGVSYQGQLRRTLRATAWVRRERTTSTQTRLDQQSVVTHGEVEYRYRQFRFSAEYRRNNQNLFYERLVDPYVFRGHQVLMRITRTFGFNL
jgi:hypothetical protein